MTKEELQGILRTLNIEWEAKPSLIYVFYETPDGRVQNFSISVQTGHTMSDSGIEQLMRQEYPAARQGHVLAVERPHTTSNRWIDIPEVCQMLHITRSTLHRWTKRGLFTPSVVEGRVYYKRAEIEDLLDNNAIMENGRLDSTLLEKTAEVS